MKTLGFFVIMIGTYFIGITAFGHEKEAAAAYRRVHSAECHYYYDDAGSTVYNGAYLVMGATGRAVYCPAPSDSELPHASTTTLNVHGYSPAANSAYSETCAKQYNTAMLTCGGLSYWAAGYGGVYGVDVAAWADAAAMPMVYNFLPANAQLFGFYMAN